MHACSPGISAFVCNKACSRDLFDGRRGSIAQQAYWQLTAHWRRDHGKAP
jgi:hypothetical protein